MKKYDKVLGKFGLLQGKYARAAQHYMVEVDKDEQGINATGLRFTRTDHGSIEYAGVYCLRTNIKDWDPESTYTQTHS